MPKGNPYHNNVHVSDVAQTMHVLLTKGGLGAVLSKLQVMASLVAALAHDYEHLGLNNDFLVKTAHSRALAHNDRAPNENHHVAATFALLQRDACNFCGALTPAQLGALRAIIIDTVLATDMAEHQRVVDLLQHNLPQMLLAHKPKMKSASPKAAAAGRRTAGGGGGGGGGGGRRGLQRVVASWMIKR
jgi:hypothetical protein